MIFSLKKDSVLQGGDDVCPVKVRPDSPPGAFQDAAFVTQNDMSKAPLIRRYDALDLLRGAAALIVCFYHMSSLFIPRGKLFSSGFLCVDLFFLLSGFVIAANYDRKIAKGLLFGIFIGDRMARLYPLFFLATLLGFVAIGAQKYGNMEILPSRYDFAVLLVNLGMLPSFLIPNGSVFPFNGASWSIFFEVWVNLLFFVVWRWLGVRLLGLLIVTGMLGVIVSTVNFSGLDVGWGAQNFVPGFFRVVFPFFLGVAIFRSKIAERWRFGAGSAVGVIILLMIVLNTRTWLPAGLHVASDLMTVLLFFPIIVIVLAAVRLPPMGCRIATALGGASYAVYLLQLPVVIIAAGFSSILLDRRITDYAPVAGFLFMPCFFGVSYLVWRLFELPAKSWVRSLWKHDSTVKTASESRCNTSGVAVETAGKAD